MPPGPIRNTAKAKMARNGNRAGDVSTADPFMYLFITFLLSLSRRAIRRTETRLSIKNAGYSYALLS
jgi:hypothetical protein